METQPHPQGPQGIPTQPKTSGLAIASLVCGILSLCLLLPALLGIIFGIIALRQINGSAGVITGKGLAIGGLVTSALGIIGILAAMLLPTLARAKTKANRVKCVNNIGNVYKAGLAFAQVNNERMPWQLNTTRAGSHFGLGASNDEYGKQGNTGINEVMAHPNSLAAAGVYGLTSM